MSDLIIATNAVQLDEPLTKTWACPEPDCGYHIVDGPVADGEQPTFELIAEHLEEHANRVAPAEEVAKPESARAAYIRGLREIADWLAEHPEVPLPYHAGYTHKGAGVGPVLRVYAMHEHDGRTEREIIRDSARAMGHANKGVSIGEDPDFVVWRQFGGIAFMVQATREEVCERVVTGTREVTVKERDPKALAAVPMVEVTKTVEDVEWICGAILADDARKVVSALLTPDAEVSA